MATFYHEETINLLSQDREQFEELRHALETGEYEIYTVSNPHHPSANVDILTHGEWVNRMNLTTLNYNLYLDGPFKGESVAFSCFSSNVVYYPVPQRIREFLDNLPADCYHYQSDQSKEYDAARAWHEYEAERDPEGAFGGRGNNVQY